MATTHLRRVALAVALSSALPSIAPAQRTGALGSGVGAMRGDAWSDWRAPEGTITPVQERGQLGMARHTFYGLLGGAVVWGAYFALPSEPDAPRGERLILLPAAVLTGAAVGFVTGLLRGAH